MPQSNAVAIFSIDPGKTTGCATIIANLNYVTVAATMRRARAKGLIKTWNEQGPYTEQTWRIAHQIVDFYFNVYIERQLIDANGMYIVIEDFKVRIMSVDLAPVWITAGLEVLLSDALSGEWKLDGFYSRQMPSEAKGFCSDQMLQRWRLYKRKSPHERDALRHIARRIDKLLKEEAIHRP